MTPQWTILVATLGRRETKLRRLLDILGPQLDAAGGQVTVEALWNNGERPIGQLRQDLLDRARAEYVCFFDDDDLPAPDYVARVLPLLDGVDYVGWRARLHRSGAVDPRPVWHTLQHHGWWEDNRGYYRDITHFNPIRRQLALKGSFAGAMEACGEDWAWANQLRGKVTSEHFIDEVMYYQFWDPADTTDGNAHPDQGVYARPVISYSWFTWHPASA
jgi:hypothetical protein